MRTDSYEPSGSGRILKGLAVSGLILAGYRLYRDGSPRTRGLLGAGLAAGAGLLLLNRYRNGSRSIRSPAPITQAIVSHSPADMPLGEPGDNESERLDEAIHETFPASDPVSVRIE
jgi:hypothetical protein